MKFSNEQLVDFIAETHANTKTFKWPFFLSFRLSIAAVLATCARVRVYARDFMCRTKT